MKACTSFDFLKSGNRFILTVLDLCTQYPEAIPLKQHTAANLAQALGTVFSRFGFPQEIFQIQEVISCQSLCRSS